MSDISIDQWGNGDNEDDNDDVSEKSAECSWKLFVKEEEIPDSPIFAFID